MQTRFLIFSLITLLTLSGCSSYSIISDYDRTVSFGNYKTYRWDDNSGKITDDILLKNPLILKHIKNAVDRELAAKGFVLRQSDPGVDFTLTAHARVKEKMVVNPPIGFAYSGGYYSRWGRRGYTTVWYDPYPYPPVSYLEEGTLIINIIDTKSDDIAWTGIARGILKDYDSSIQLNRQIDEVVTKIMAQFPPVVKKRESLGAVSLRLPFSPPPRITTEETIPPRTSQNINAWHYERKALISGYDNILQVLRYGKACSR
jgi:hypothetical protein